MFKSVQRSLYTNIVFWLLVSLKLPGLCIATTSIACNCIRVKSCYYFTSRLLRHAPAERDGVYTQVRDAFCGFEGLDPLVCCPDITAATLPSLTLRMAHIGFSDKEEAMTAKLHKLPWVWEHHSSRPLANRFANVDVNDFGSAEKNLLDYMDFKTQRNCPPVLNEEFEANGLPEPNHFDHGPHVTQHSHYKYHIQHDGDDDDDNESEDNPVVIPDDLRFQDILRAKANKSLQNNQSMVQPTNSGECGISLNTRIAGGIEGDVAQYPWLTRIAYRNRTSQLMSYRCSGSLINNFYILTAAHCVINLVSDLELSHVRIGDDISMDCVPNAPNCDVPNIFTITDVVVHPNYDRPKYANDIALLRIDNSLNTNFTSICLPVDATSSLADRLIGQMGVVAGWSTANMESNTTVKFLRLPIVNTTDCAITYARYSENFQNPIVIMPSQLCAQGRPNNDVCRGDSGGPFMDDGKSGLLNTDGRYTLLGIVGFGPNVCDVSHSIPGVYSRVSSYIAWIFNNLKL